MKKKNYLVVNQKTLRLNTRFEFIAVCFIANPSKFERLNYGLFVDIFTRSAVVSDILDGAGNVADVGAGETGNGDTAILGHVDVVLLDHSLALLDSEAREGEHTNLLGDVSPGALGADLLEVLAEKLTHLGDPVCHVNELLQPLGAEVRLVKDEGSNSSTVERRRRVSSSNDDLELGEDSAGGLLVTADEVKSTGSLTVKTHNLSERLSNAHLEALVEEVSQADAILVQVAGDEALVGSVEEGIESVLVADSGDLLPLVESGIDTRGVVSAGVEEHGGTGSGVSKILEHTLEVETLSLLIEVAVLAHLEAGSLEDRVVVAPGGVANVDGSGSVRLEEVADNAEGAGTRESLGRGNSTAGDISVLPAEEGHTGTLVEVLVAIDGRVLLVELEVVGDHLLGLANDGENVGLAVLGSVGTDTEVDLLGELVGLVASGERKDGVSRGLSDVTELTLAEGSGLSRVDDLGVKVSESLHFNLIV